jgi:hypothetical protein
MNLRLALKGNGTEALLRKKENSKFFLEFEDIISCDQNSKN